MLTHLQVRNLAVIEEASIGFEAGLNVLTGETGAGKSIVVDALALLAGVRAATDLIRKGADRLTVTGVFRPAGRAWKEPLEEAGIVVDEDELVVRREVSREGPNRVFLNDQPATLRLLGEIAPYLMRIHAQREELGLVSPEFQRALLDRSGGEEGRELLAATVEAYGEYREVRARWQRLAGDQTARQERLDLLRFQQREIEDAGVSRGEEDSLRADRAVLRHSEAIQAALGGALDRLFEGDGSAVDRMVTSERELRGVGDWEPRTVDWANDLGEMRIRLEETSREIGRRLQEVDSDPTRLDDIEDRLALLERLFRKYGGSSAGVLDHQQRIAAEIEELTLDDAGRDELERRMGIALDAFRSRALEVSEARRRWAERLCEGVHRELADLAMSKAEFSIETGVRESASSPLEVGGRRIEFGADGIDEVSFRLAANPGEATGPLSAVASGGELSRVYLALRLAVGSEGRESVGALVFDEVDSGVGGAEAAALGEKLRRLASNGQVFAVTHLAQVASQGHRHFRVCKRVQGGRTRISVEALGSEERVEEVARMLAGKKVTSLSRSHAEELLSGVV